MKQIALFFATTAIALLSACASRPESIHASYVSHEKYTGLSCAELASRKGDTRAELEKYSRMQDSKANTDAVAYFSWHFPSANCRAITKATWRV